MKKLLLSSTAVLILTSAHGQFYSDTIFFEKNSQSITIDTSQGGNAWQIGEPQKIFFDSAYSKSNAIVTDTLNSYPINNLSSFQFTIKQPTPSIWQYTFPILEFYHKYDTDSLKDGGYIETSWDGGTTWTNVANDQYIFVWNTLNDTIQGGIPAFTGKSNWSHVSIEWWPWCWVANNPPSVYPDSIIARFTFKSDSIQTNKEGWMIDNIIISTMGCPFGAYEMFDYYKLNINPNPFSSQTTLQADTPLHNATLTAYNCFGQTVAQIQNISGPSITFNRGNLPSGVYFVRLAEDNKVIAINKLIITDK